MADDWQVSVRALLQASRVAFLATRGQQGPETSMAPFALYQGGLLLHLSKLARHTANIESSPHIGAMICTPELPDCSPLALPRLSLSGVVELVADIELEPARATYLSHIPEAEALFSFADFRLFRLIPNEVYWVGGFGQARRLPVEAFQSLAG